MVSLKKRRIGVNIVFIGGFGVGGVIEASNVAPGDRVTLQTQDDDIEIDVVVNYSEGGLYTGTITNFDPFQPDGLCDRFIGDSLDFVHGNIFTCQPMIH